MAFEAFLANDGARPRRRRRITTAVSIGVHVVLLGVGVVYSFWHVEELTPPTLSLAITMAPPPPPPPPPPPKKRSSTKPKTPQEVVQPKPEDIVQPQEEPEPEDDGEDDGSDDGVEGGVAGGVAGGVVGGVVGAPPVAAPPPPSPPRMLPPAVGQKQRTYAPEPSLPEVFRRVGSTYVVMVKICVNLQGDVDSVKVMQSADPAIDDAVTSTVKTWKHKPMTVDNHAIPFCYATRFNFSTRE